MSAIQRLVFSPAGKGDESRFAGDGALDPAARLSRGVTG
jgi:hypothetical protein